MEQKCLNIKESGILFKYFEDETNVHENKQIMDWLNEDPENEMFFKELESLWNGDNIKNIDEKYNLPKAWDKIDSKVITSDFDSEQKQPTSLKINIRFLLKIAAIFIVLIALWQIVKYTKEDIIMQSFNETIEYIFPDGSKVWLNKNAVIKYSKRYNKKSRSITLDGEAFFEVESNKEIPFIVTANNAVVKVTGTSFNIDASVKNQVEVIVKSGEVKVANNLVNNNNFVVLKKGEKFIVFNNKKIIEKTHNTDVNFDAWKTKILVFEQTKMPEVVKVIENVYDVSILLDENLYNCELIAKFDNQSIENVLEIIKYTFNIEIEEADNVIQLKGLGCN